MSNQEKFKNEIMAHMEEMSTEIANIVTSAKKSREAFAKLCEPEGELSEYLSNIVNGWVKRNIYNYYELKFLNDCGMLKRAPGIKEKYERLLKLIDDFGNELDSLHGR